METFKQARQFVAWNADTGIPDGQLDMTLRGRRLDLDRYFTLESKLEGVGQQVQNDLLPHLLIDMDRLRQCGAVDPQGQFGLLRRGCKIGRQLGGERGEVSRLEMCFDAPGLNAREVEQRVDQLEQAQAVAVRGLQPV